MSSGTDSHVTTGLSVGVFLSPFATVGAATMEPLYNGHHWGSQFVSY